MRPRRLRHPLPGLSGGRRRGRHRHAAPPRILRAHRSQPRPLRLHPQSSVQKGLLSRPRHDRRAPLRPPFQSCGSPKLQLQHRRRRVRSRPPLLNRDGPRMRLRLPQRQRRLRHRLRQSSGLPGSNASDHPPDTANREAHDAKGRVHDGPGDNQSRDESNDRPHGALPFHHAHHTVPAGIWNTPAPGTISIPVKGATRTVSVNTLAEAFRSFPVSAARPIAKGQVASSWRPWAPPRAGCLRNSARRQIPRRRP